uniref:Uncharacterized protein n=1 Tax=Anguilla anguilla TaxID=7936 RepID=A0A0E9R9Z3_ANGAN
MTQMMMMMMDHILAPKHLSECIKLNGRKN